MATVTGYGWATQGRPSQQPLRLPRMKPGQLPQQRGASEQTPDQTPENGGPTSEIAVEQLPSLPAGVQPAGELTTGKIAAGPGPSAAPPAPAALAARQFAGALPPSPAAAENVDRPKGTYRTSRRLAQPSDVEKVGQFKGATLRNILQSQALGDMPQGANAKAVPGAQMSLFPNMPANVSVKQPQQPAQSGVGQQMPGQLQLGQDPDIEREMIDQLRAVREQNEHGLSLRQPYQARHARQSAFQRWVSGT